MRVQPIILFLSLLAAAACSQPPASAPTPTPTVNPISTPGGSPPPSPANTPTPLSSPVGAATNVPYVLQLAEVKFELPAGWHVRNSAPETVVVYSPDEELLVSFTETFEPEKKKAELLAGFGKDFRGITRGGVKTGDFNGMRHTAQAGTATNAVTKKTYDWSVDTLLHKKPLVVYSQINRAVKDQYQDTYKRLIASVRPLTAP